jgi:hypothetical protein
MYLKVKNREKKNFPQETTRYIRSKVDSTPTIWVLPSFFSLLEVKTALEI